MEVSLVYPGRASGAPLLDLFVTLLSMGCAGFTSALEARVECMDYMREKLTLLAAANGERVLDTPHNTISMVRVAIALQCAQT